MQLFKLKKQTIKLDYEIGDNNSIKSTIMKKFYYKSIDNKNIVNLELLGSCETCPMSPMTLKAVVEEAIKKQVPEINGIYAVNGTN